MGAADEVSLGGHKPVGTTEHSGLSEDELFQLLANQRRRHILLALIREGKPLDIGILSQEIAAWEDGNELEEVSSKDRKRVYTALQQSHLPKMDKVGVLEYDRDRGMVEPTSTLEDVEHYLGSVRGRELPWSDYFLGVTVLVAIVLGGVALELAPFTLLPSFVWSVFVVVVLAVLAVTHRYYLRQSRPEIASEWSR
ncbi:DUF7344 domain-containing protein [Natronosalvus vescus]|uniref:DUF7344 domain-containing protein n=1 Tax=Natronosalvus vescus TaxID=2953881 RepID=UPI003CCCF41A